jgi:hypothetical protein
MAIFYKLPKVLYVVYVIISQEVWQKLFQKKLH